MNLLDLVQRGVANAQHKFTTFENVYRKQNICEVAVVGELPRHVAGRPGCGVYVSARFLLFISIFL